MVKIKEKAKYAGLMATSAGVCLYSDFATHFTPPEKVNIREVYRDIGCSFSLIYKTAPFLVNIHSHCDESPTRLYCREREGAQK